MTSEYRDMRWGDFAQFKYGKMPDKKRFSASVTDYPVFSGYRVVGYYDEYNVDKDELVIVARGVGGTGDVKLTDSKCYLTNLSIVALMDESVALKRYLYYYFMLSNLRYLDSGSAQSQITISDLQNVMISLPSIDLQQTVVNVLTCLDARIAENKKINHHLEQMAQAIFKSWFVDFEPFGGEQPPEWRTGSLTDIADYLNGLAMQRFRPSEDEVGLPVLKIKELRQGSCDTQSELCSPSIRSDYIVHDGDVIFSWSGSLLVDFWCGGDCGLNQHLFKVTSRKYDKWFYYAWTCHYLARFVAMAADKATTMGHIKREALENAEVIIPDADNYRQLGGLLAPLYEQIINNRIESRKLSLLRDTLLPKLMTGEISVAEATNE